MSWTLVGMRLVHFVAGTILFGSSLFALVAGGPALPRWPVRAAAVAALLSAVGWLVAVAAAMSNRPLAAVDAGTLRLVLTATAFGAVWQVQLALGVAVVAATWWGGRRGTAVVLLLAGGLLVGVAAVGHAGMAGGIEGLLRIANHSLHLIAGAVWLGGLVPLAALLRQSGGASGPLPLTVVRAVERFSALAIAAVSVLLLTGGANVRWLLASAAGIASDWGRVLVIKLALVTVLLVLAAINRLILLPRLRVGHGSDPGGAVLALRQTVLLEQGLALLVLAAASLLGTLPPPIALTAAGVGQRIAW